MSGKFTTEYQIKLTGDATGAKKAIGDVNSQLEKVEQTAGKAEESFSKLASASTILAAAGAALFAPAVLAANSYVSAVGQADAVSRKWLMETQRQQKAQLELGRKATEALMPFQRALTDILEKISRLDPRVLQAGVAVGGALAVAGAVGLLVGQIGIFASQAARLVVALNRATAGQLAANGGMVGAGMLGAGAGAVAGTLLGVELVKAYGRATNDEQLASTTLESVFLQARVLILGAFADFVVDLQEDFQAITDPLLDIAEFLVPVGGELIKAITGIVGVFDQIKLMVEEQVEKLTGAFEKARLGFLLSIANLSIDLGIKKIDIGDAIGLNADEIQGQLDAIGDRAEYWDEQRAASAIRTQAAIDAVDNSTEEFLGKLGELRTMLGGNGIANRLIGMVQRALVPEMTPETGGGETSGRYTQGTLDAFDAYRKGMQQADQEFYRGRQKQMSEFAEATKKLEADFYKDRDKSLAQFQKQEQQATDQHNKSLAKMNSDFDRQEAEALVDYNKERGELEAEFAADEQKRIAEFYLARQRAEEDGQRRLIEAVGRLDAIAVLRELQGANTERQRAKQDFDLTTKQNKAEHQKQLEDNKRSFDEQRNQRQRDHRERLSDMRQQFTEQRRLNRQMFDEQRAEQLAAFRQGQQLRVTEFNNKLAQEQQEYRQQRTVREQQFIDQVNQLQQWGKYELNARAKHYEALQRQLDVFMARSVNTGQRGGTPYQAQPQVPSLFSKFLPGFAVGGSVPRTGPAMLHEGEYVLTRDTASAIQRGIGTLTQGRLAAMGSGGQSVINMGGLHFGNIGGYSPQAIGDIVERRLVALMKRLS